MERMKIKGMSCQHCVGSVTKALATLPGLSQVRVDLEKGEATFANSGTSREEIRAAIRRIGFDPAE